MQIKFKSIHAVNFLSFKEFNLNLDNNGFCLINGINNNPVDNSSSNGSGKSSIIEAIMWALTGETVRGVKHIVNNQSTEGAYVELEFEFDSKNYKIIRSKDHKEYKTNLLIYENDVNISGKGIKDSEKILAERLPDLTFDFISSVIILGQGLPERFTNNTPSGRKEVLEKLSKSDYMIADLKDRLAKRQKEANDNKRTLEDKLLVNKTEISSLERHISSIQNEIDNYGTEEAIQIDISNTQSIIEDSKEILKQAGKDKKAISEELNELRAQYTGTVNSKQLEVDTLEKQMRESADPLKDEVNDLSVKKRTLEAEIKKIKSMKDTCPTCGQKLKGIVIPDTSAQEDELNSINATLAELNEQLRQAKDWHDKSLEEINERHKSNISQLDAKIRELSDDLRDAETLYNNTQMEITNFSNDLARLTTQLSVFTAKLDNLKAQLLEDNVKLAELNNNSICINKEMEVLEKHLEVLSKFNTYLSRDFRGYLLTNVLQFIDAKAKNYCQDIFGNKEIAIQLNGNNIDITFAGKEYSALSGGEKQRIDLIAQLSLRDMLMTYMGFSCNIILFDEIMDNLDSKATDKVIDMITNKLNDLNSIYIISHHADSLSIPTDNIITVVKNAEGVSEIG